MSAYLSPPPPSNCATPRALAARVSARPAAAGWRAFLRRALHAIETRQQLAEMDARMLKDIGLSRAEALEEAHRAPWDLGRRRP
ncbi:DUF1127 domain-containing protein [Roseomonas sp. KE0001]|uniref:DUF1127 domain-containing protein n=1 Tax=Roseomonas sp. KE0001 TaxID=2479201 RepID=UPI0018DF3269|nr:DUF1127 domain-containing protein [Roseomonas sp. KE0001]MBI0435792.1 DUF1127 domain-containing protein [Roseomonas sp. KE0001]